MNGWQQVLGTWHEGTFDLRTEQGIAGHLLREAVELCEAVGLTNSQVRAQVEQQLERPYKETSVGEETADVAILALVMAHQAGFSLEGEVASKHARNMTRTWKPADEHGVSEHVDD